MQAILTKYHGPTNTRPSRVSATWGKHRVYVSWDHGLDTIENHAQAVRAMRTKITTARMADASGMVFIPAESPNGSGYVWVRSDNAPTARVVF